MLTDEQQAKLVSTLVEEVDKQLIYAEPGPVQSPTCVHSEISVVATTIKINFQPDFPIAWGKRPMNLTPDQRSKATANMVQNDGKVLLYARLKNHEIKEVAPFYDFKQEAYNTAARKMVYNISKVSNSIAELLVNEREYTEICWRLAHEGWPIMQVQSITEVIKRTLERWKREASLLYAKVYVANYYNSICNNNVFLD
ncbi:hypothetical protein BX661DRAFT_198896 [Kickxella alabastrina]|uniref:uncharacterized protein n=1 Tax=Kickxella alabastrina TaxID=61397 RepID=UPI00221F7573|nr:uncharacterized protein BX661DRAFT_198896 [Kickxella alabastrina]KAI7826282.1 hypothetical protein BX661DRAFT_198896 [Kickxella alabastrina]